VRELHNLAESRIEELKADRITIQNLRQYCDNKNSRIEELATKSGYQDQEITRLRHLLQKNSDEITRLNALIKQKESELSNPQSIQIQIQKPQAEALLTQQIQIQELTNQLQQQETLLSSRNKQIQSLNSLVEKLSRNKPKQNVSIQELQNILTQLSSLQEINESFDKRINDLQTLSEGHAQALTTHETKIIQIQELLS
jgi:chromosome segregation ATPase